MHFASPETIRWTSCCIAVTQNSLLFIFALLWMPSNCACGWECVCVCLCAFFRSKQFDCLRNTLAYTHEILFTQGKSGTFVCTHNTNTIHFFLGFMHVCAWDLVSLWWFERKRARSQLRQFSIRPNALIALFLPLMQVKSQDVCKRLSVRIIRCKSIKSIQTWIISSLLIHHKHVPVETKEHKFWIQMIWCDSGKKRENTEMHIVKWFFCNKNNIHTHRNLREERQRERRK